jgi:hypothetical protein
MTLIGGILFSSEILKSGWFQALATFVAVNTLVYVTLSLAKVLPRKRE